MTNTITLVKNYSVIEFEGRYWGIQYEDGHVTSWDWGPIEKALLCEREFCLTPSYVVHKSSPHISELEKGRFFSVERTTTYKLESE